MDRTTQSSLYLTEACWEGRSKAHKMLSVCGLRQYTTQSEMLLMFSCCAFCTVVLQTGCNSMLPR